MPHKLYIWHKLAITGLLAGALAAVGLLATGRLSGAAGIFDCMLIVAGFGWAGALAGGTLDWLRYRRSPLEPLFEGRFKAYYGKGLTLRFACAFAAGWAASVLLAAVVALSVGETGEMRIFMSLKAVALLLVFLVVFALEGAIIGFLLDLARRLAKRG